MNVTVEAPAIVPLNLTINRPVLGDIGSSTLFYDQTLPEFDGSGKKIIYSDVQYVSHTGTIERIMPASLINNVVRFTNVDVYASEEIPIINFTYRVTGIVTGT